MEGKKWEWMQVLNLRTFIVRDYITRRRNGEENNWIGSHKALGKATW
jgi:hypothetical protein